jgi:4-hydroxy-tetrahydrodipicolinate synthase
MQNQNRISGVLAPALTPFGRDLAPDTARCLRHCQWLLANGCSGLAVFGTTSEANSMSVGEKLDLLQALISGGVPAAALMPGTGQCAFTDSVSLTRRAVELGCGGVLMLPPFYYKGVSDEGLYRYFAEVIERVGDARLHLYLYHIPPVSQVPISLALIERLLKNYTGVVAGAKDSSGDWHNTLAMLNAFATSGFDVFTGSETLLLDNLRHGGRGCITATGNINPGPIDQLYRRWRSADADQVQAGISALRTIVQKWPMIPALKAIVAHFGKDPQWRRLRPPLVELEPAQEQSLIAELLSVNFYMPGLAA